MEVSGVNLPDFVADWGFWGVVFGIIGIIIAVLIYVRTGEIQKKQLENAEGSYATNTEKNMKEIHEYFNAIIRITKESVSKEEAEQKLARYL